MENRRILAAVVSFNPSESILTAVDALRSQIGSVLVIDNGSDGNSLRFLEILERKAGVTCIRLHENRGIGHALNLCIERAIDLEFDWILTMDQDSVVDANMIHEYERAIARHPSATSLTPVVPELMRVPPRDQQVELCITSGNLVRLAVYRAVGLYDEGFFVDAVDFDFCLRLRGAGFQIWRVATATMRHQLGEPTKIPRIARRFYARHPPLRRYYMARNFLYLARRHLQHHPFTVAKIGVSNFIQGIMCIFLDRNPYGSLRAIAHGIRDFRLGVVGRKK